MPEKIVWSKRQMYEEMRRGEYGNTMLSADSLEPLLEAGINLFTLRSKRVGWPYFRAEMTLEQLLAYLPTVPIDNDVVYCESPVHERNVINGEFCRTDSDWLVVKYLEGPYNQRQAMTCGRAKEIKNASANLLLRGYFSPASYNNAMRLLEEYELGSVVEFTVADRFIGTELHNNTVFWEVRSRY